MSLLGTPVRGETSGNVSQHGALTLTSGLSLQFSKNRSTQITEPRLTEGDPEAHPYTGTGVE